MARRGGDLLTWGVILIGGYAAYKSGWLSKLGVGGTPAPSGGGGGAAMGDLAAMQARIPLFLELMQEWKYNHRLRGGNPMDWNVFRNWIMDRGQAIGSSRSGYDPGPYPPAYFLQG